MTKWAFPASTILNPNQFLIVFASGDNTVDPLGYYHTSYKLDADGEHVVLAAPDHTILSQINADGSSYPAQDHGYFLRHQRHVLVNADSTSTYIIPTNGNLGTHLDRSKLQSRGTTASPPAKPPSATTRRPRRSTTPTISKRPFPPAPRTSTSAPNSILPTPRPSPRLNLNLKYDDGVVVYLNGHKVVTQLAPRHTSLELPGHRLSRRQLGNRRQRFLPHAFPRVFCRPAPTSSRFSSSIKAARSSDLLVVPTLTAQTGAGSDQLPRHAHSRCPKQHDRSTRPENRSGRRHADKPRRRPADNDHRPSHPVCCAGQHGLRRPHLPRDVRQRSPPRHVRRRRLRRRRSSQATASTPCRIPSSRFRRRPNGPLVRHRCRRQRHHQPRAKLPRIRSTRRSITAPSSSIPTVTTSLPVIYWFVQDTNAAATDTGTRASLYFDGQFYDNIEVDLHGQIDQRLSIHQKVHSTSTPIAVSNFNSTARSAKSATSIS